MGSPLFVLPDLLEIIKGTPEEQETNENGEFILGWFNGGVGGRAGGQGRGGVTLKKGPKGGGRVRVCVCVPKAET